MNRILKKPIALSVLAFMILLFLLTTAHGAIIYVGHDDIYTDIKSAIDAGVNGDTIIVRDGTYTGPNNKNLGFNGKAITLRSENGPDNCIIDCEGDGRGFYFHSGEGESAVVDGFTIRNGYGPVDSIDFPGMSAGGGIYCTNYSSPLITNNIIIENTADYGGGILCFNHSSPRITNNIIKKNISIWAGGGGIYCFKYCSSVIENNIITENEGGLGGGLKIEMFSSVEVINNIITKNSSRRKGGGITCGNSSPRIINNTITENTGQYKAGGADFWYANPIIVNTIFWGNNGGEISHVASSISVTYSDIQGGYWGEGNIDADPLFAGGGDYRLTAGSPCIDYGTSEGAPTTDIEGNPRPQGNGYDMGAYEYSSVISALNNLREATKDTIDHNTELVADTFAEVVVSLRTESDDLVLAGVKVAASVLTIASNPGATASEIHRVMGISKEAANLLIGANAFLSWYRAGYNGVKFAQALDNWWSSNESFLLDENKNKEAISTKLKQSIAEEFDIFVDSEGEPLPSPGTKGLKAYVDSTFDDYISYLAASMPSDYPVDCVVRKVRTVETDIRNSQNSEIFLLPVNDDASQAIQILGSPIGFAAKIDSVLTNYRKRESVSVGLLVGTLGKLAFVIGTGGIGGVAEALVFTALSIGSTFNDFATMKTEEALHVLTQNLVNSVVNEMVTIAQSSTNLLDYLVTLEQQGWVACSADSSGVQIASDSFSMDDVQIPRGENGALVSGSMVVANNGPDTIPVTALVYIYRAMTAGGQTDDYPVMIAKSDTHNLSAGSNTTLQIQPASLFGSDALGADVYIGVAYLVAGPSIVARYIGPVNDEFNVVSDRIGERTRITTSLVRSSVGTGEHWEGYYVADASAVYSDLSLFYPGSDLDLHVYDAFGNHVGINYSTEQLELQIPGAIYSGSTSNPEVIRLPQSAGQAYTIRVVGIQTSSQESFEVIASDIGHRESILAATPCSVMTNIDIDESTQLTFLISAKEIGGQMDYVGLTANSTDLLSGSNKITSSNLNFEIPSSHVPAGSSVDVTVTINVPSSTPPGTYSGTIHIGTNSVDVPLSLNVLGGSTPTTGGDGGDGGGGGCFIATAAYGSSLHPHIDILRNFRDEYFMPNKLGRSLVNLYYKYSPFVANIIAKHKVLKFAVRISLLPIIVFSYSMVHLGPIIAAVVGGFIFVIPILFVLSYREKVRPLEARDPKALASLG